MAGNNSKIQALHLPKEQGFWQKRQGTIGKTELHDPRERMGANR